MSPACKCVVFSNPGHVGLYRTRCSTLFGYPARGVTVGGVDAGPGHWNPNAYGWTQQQAPILKHPTLNLWATYWYNPDVSGDKERLSQVEYEWLCEYLDDWQYLDATWDGATFWEMVYE